MQLALPQLSKHLQQGLHTLYVLHGDEALLQQEAADSIRRAARAQGFTERSVFTVAGAHVDWASILASGAEMSLFGDRQIVEIHIPSGKPGKEGATALQQLAHANSASSASSGNDGVLTLITLPKLDSASQKSAWFTALESQGVTIRIDPIERHALPNWIAQRLALQGQHVAAGEEGQRTLQFFADQVEGNLLAAHQEVQKLALLHPTGTLHLADIEAAVLNVARYDPSQLPVAVWTGQSARVQKILDGLEAEGEAAVRVHWVLAEDVRALHRARIGLDAGRPLPMVLRELRVWGPREKLFERVLPRLSRPQLAQWLQDAHHADGIIKGLPVPGWPQGAWPALHHWTRQMSAGCATSKPKRP
jgi:DNA polymerase-3 subunit delta